MREQSENPVFVIEGTAAWAAWQKFGGDWPPPATCKISGEIRRGAFFPTLFPPSPPPEVPPPPDRAEKDRVLFSFVIDGKTAHELWITRRNIEFATQFLGIRWDVYAKAQAADPDQ